MVKENKSINTSALSDVNLGATRMNQATAQLKNVLRSNENHRGTRKGGLVGEFWFQPLFAPTLVATLRFAGAGVF